MHGMGTGKLRKAIHELLRAHRRVKEFRLGAVVKVFDDADLLFFLLRLRERCEQIVRFDFYKNGTALHLERTAESKNSAWASTARGNRALRS